MLEYLSTNPLTRNFYISLSLGNYEFDLKEFIHLIDKDSLAYNFNYDLDKEIFTYMCLAYLYTWFIYTHTYTHIY